MTSKVLRAECTKLLRRVQAQRLVVNDAEHRALFTRYMTELKPEQRRVNTTNHLDLCHWLRGRTLFDSRRYYLGRIGVGCAITWHCISFDTNFAVAMAAWAVCGLHAADCYTRMVYLDNISTMQVDLIVPTKIVKN